MCDFIRKSFRNISMFSKTAPTSALRTEDQGEFFYNQYENEQFKSAMRELGFNRTSPQWEKAHREVMKYKKTGKYFDKYRDLLEYIKKSWGYKYACS